jgi:hypothetical protein
MENPGVSENQEDARSALTALLEQGEPYDPAQLRTIAELTELLYTVEKAQPWWERAAEAGDEDAAGYLELLREDEADPVKAKAESDELMRTLGIEEPWEQG